MKEKNLLYFSALIGVIALISLLSDFFLLLVHGFSQMVFEGNSTGKTLIMLSWFFLLPLISFVFLKFRFNEKLEIHSGKLLRLFLLFAFLGYALGLIQFTLIGLEFHSLGPFATITEQNGIVSWQASKITHNHFPKASLYFLQSLFGLDLGGSYDDGFPWFSFIPNAGLWSSAFLLIELIIFVSGVLYLNSRIKKFFLFDFLVFVAGFLALMISVLDGGIGSGAAMFAVFFFALYFSRNYLKQENLVVVTLLPLLVIGFLGFADVILPVEIGNNFYASSIILFFGLSYFFYSEMKFRKISLNALNAVLALILIASFFMSAAQYLEFSFGREIQPNYISYNFQLNEEGAGILVYGLPKEIPKEKINAEISFFGKILESDKSGWTYYARISPQRNFRTGEIEEILKQKFNSVSYLYVEEVTPFREIESYRIQWFKETNSQEFLKDKFLASEILERTDNNKTNSTEIVVQGKTEYLWQMLSILSEINSNGFNGRILLIKNS